MHTVLDVSVATNIHHLITHLTHCKVIAHSEKL